MLNKKIATYIFVKNPNTVLYPPLLDDIESDYFALTEQPDLHSDCWTIKQEKNLDKIEKTIRENPQAYFGFYDKYIEIKEEQIIVGNLLEDDQCIVTVPTIESLVPKGIPLLEPKKTITPLNPSYTNGKYDGYPLLLSICLPISNRVDSLEKCLLGLKPLLDQLPAELIVVDTSNDGSRQIAEAYGAKIISFTWIGDFSAARNAAIREASGAWIFSIDDDEWLDDVSEIISFFKSSDWKKYNVGLYKVRNYTTQEGKEFEDVNVQRMAKNHPALHYIHAIHESFDLSLMPEPLRLKYFTTFAHHYGYAYKNDAEKERKAYRNIAGSYTSLKESPHDLRLLYQLANELTIIRDFSSSAAFCFKVMALAKLNPQLNFRGMEWHKNALMFLFLIGHLSNNNALILTIKPLINLYKLDCFKAATIHYILAINAFNTSEYENTCTYANSFYKFRNEFLNQKNQDDLSSGITVNLVTPPIRVNALYIINTFALLELGKSREAVQTFSKVDLDLTNELDLAILAKIIFDFTVDEFTELALPLNNQLVEALFKYCKHQVNHEGIDSHEAFKSLYNKVFKRTTNKDNIYYQLIKMYANASDMTSYAEFRTDKTSLFSHMEDIIICAVKNEISLFEFLPMFSYEDLQQILKIFASQETADFQQLVTKFLSSVQLTNFSSFTLKEVFIVSGILEITLINDEMCIWQKTSKEYKEHFTLYIDLLNRWSSQNYNQILFEYNFDLLPATFRGAYYIEKGLKEKESKNMKKYMELLKAAVEECPLFDTGVKLLLTELKTENSVEAPVSPKTEFEILGEQLKATAKQMIATRRYNEAENILLQLSKLISNDKELDSLLSLCKSVN